MTTALATARSLLLGHASWVAGPDRWEPARNREVGTLLRTSAGTWVQVTAIDHDQYLVATYNLTGDRAHAYYVMAGQADALVHNCGETVYRTSRERIKAVEADGLNPNLHQTGDRSVYIGDRSVVTRNYVGQAGYEHGFYEYPCILIFRPSSASTNVHMTGGEGIQWQIPVGDVPRFNQLIVDQRWVNYYGGFEW